METLRRRFHVPLLLFAALLLGGGITAGVTPDACACSCADLSVREAAQRADLVAVAVLEASDPDGGRTEHRFRVERIQKGTATSSVTVRSATSGASCGLEGMSPGTRYVLFADHTSTGWEANLCGGTRPANVDAVAELEKALGTGTPAPSPSAAVGTAATRPRSHHWLGISAGLAGAALVVLVGLRRRR